MKVILFVLMFVSHLAFAVYEAPETTHYVGVLFDRQDKDFYMAPVFQYFGEEKFNERLVAYRSSKRSESRLEKLRSDESSFNIGDPSGS